MVISLWLTFMGCAGGDGNDTGRDSSPPEDAAPPIDSGTDSGDIDADGDGWTPNAGDCNDERPHVHPGAPDYCDGLDADCDGEPIPDGSCGEAGDAAKMWTWSFEGSGERGAYLGRALGDVDADGRADVAAYDVLGGEFGPLAAQRLLELPRQGPLPSLAWSTEFPYWSGVALDRGGDVNGDGIDDMWGQAGSDFGYTGAVFLFLGRVGGAGATDPIRVDLAADSVWIDTPRLEVAGLAGAANFDGVGFRDAAIILRGADDTYWAALPGSSEPQGGVEFTSLPLVALRYESSLVGAGFEVLTDLDGDGIDEVAASTQRVHDGWQVLTVVEGEDLLAGGDLVDVGHDAWMEASDQTYVELGFSALDGEDPDINGDGLADLTFGVLTEVESRLMFVSGGVPNGDMGDLVFLEIGGEEDEYFLPLAWTEDTDNDSLVDLMLHNGCLLPSSRLAAGGVLDFDEIKGPCIGRPSGFVSAVADMTGDGYPEWVFNDIYWVPPEGGDYYYNRSLIIEGFPIPWDDPTKW